MSTEGFAFSPVDALVELESFCCVELEAEDAALLSLDALFDSLLPEFPLAEARTINTRKMTRAINHFFL